jgi:hypothetical protein
VTCEVARRLMALLRIVEQGPAPYGVLGDDALLDAWFGTGSPIPPGQVPRTLCGQLPAALSSVGTSSGSSSARCGGSRRYRNLRYSCAGHEAVTAGQRIDGAIRVGEIEAPSGARQAAMAQADSPRIRDSSLATSPPTLGLDNLWYRFDQARNDWTPSPPSSPDPRDLL